MRGAAASAASSAASRTLGLLCRWVIEVASDVLDRDVRKEMNPAGVLSGAKRASQAELEDREESDESGRGVSAKRPKPPPSKTQPLDERSSAALWCARHATIASAAAAVRPAPGAVMTKRPTNASPPGCATSGASSAAAKEIILSFAPRAERRRRTVSVAFGPPFTAKS